MARRGGGGLVTALRSLVSQHDVTWIASAMTEEDRAVAAEASGEAFEETARDGSLYRLRFVVTIRAAYDWFYNVVSNPTLWFIQHYLWDLAYEPDFDQGLHHAWEEGYVRVNQAFADAILSELEREPERDGLLPRLPPLPRAVLRPEGGTGRAARALHPHPLAATGLLARAAGTDSPGGPRGPARERHRRPSTRRRWSRNFVRSCADFVGVEVDREEGSLVYGDRRVLVQSHPISIDPAEFDELAVSEAVRAAERELVARRPEKLILRVDRTDLSKNIVRGFRAFEAYLAAHPEMHGRVTHARAPGSLAAGHPQLRRVPRPPSSVRRARVNDRFQPEGWIPIELHVEDDFAAGPWRRTSSTTCCS